MAERSPKALRDTHQLPGFHCQILKGELNISPPQHQRHMSRDCPWGESSPLGNHWHMVLETPDLRSCFRYLLLYKKPL